jgi:hypothetical protein
MRIVERVYSFDLSVLNVNAIKDVIHTIHRLHVEDSCDVISLDSSALAQRNDGVDLHGTAGG